MPYVSDPDFSHALTTTGGLAVQDNMRYLLTLPLVYIVLGVFIGFFVWAYSQDIVFSAIVGIGIAIILTIGWAVYEIRFLLMLNMSWLGEKPICHIVDDQNDNK